MTDRSRSATEVDAASVGHLLDLLRAVRPPEPAPCAGRAVALDDGGSSHVGRTVRLETAGLGACATRIALARVRAEGTGRVLALVALADRQRARLCGLCRQTLHELAPDTRIFLVDGDGTREVRGLLPRPFGVPESGERR